MADSVKGMRELKFATYSQSRDMTLDMEAFEIAVEDASLVCVVTPQMCGVRNDVERIIKLSNCMVEMERSS